MGVKTELNEVKEHIADFGQDGTERTENNAVAKYGGLLLWVGHLNSHTFF